MKIARALFFLSCIAGFVSDGSVLRGSFLKDNVKPEHFDRLTENAKRGRTHLASSGSGFFVSNDGYILTNHHVVDGAKEVVVIRKGMAFLADVVAKNKELDLGLLKITVLPPTAGGSYAIDGIQFVDGSMVVPALALADDCKVGQTVYAFGFPKTSVLGYEPKMTRGIVNSLTGYRGDKTMFQMDAGIDHGNSGGPVVDEYGNAVGVAVAGVNSLSANFNYAVNIASVRRFLPKQVKTSWGCPGRRMLPDKLSQKTVDALVFVLIYNEGACERISSTRTNSEDVHNRERETLLKKAVLDAKWCKLKKEWGELLKITDWLLDVKGEFGEVREWNDLARDELGMHLVITAEVDGRDVVAHVKPICGFKDEFVACGRPVALYGGRGKRGFDVEAKLTYEDDEWQWAGTCKCVYDWRGTKEKRIVLKKVGKK